MNKILLGSAVAVLLLAGCGDEKKTTTETVTKVETQAVEAIKKDVAEVTEATKDAAQTVSKETVAVVENTVENVTNATETKVSETANKIEEVKETTKEIAVNVIDETKQAATNLTEDVKTIVNKTVEEKTAAVAEVQALDGELLYKSCASCHGLKGEKEALGKSQVIAGWNKEKTIQALNGYKDGTYGGVMKNIMKGQVATKTDLEIDALATFISNL